MILKMQKMVYVVTLESSSVQQEATVVGRVKYYTSSSTLVRIGLCCLLHHMSTEHDMPLQEDGRLSGFLKRAVAKGKSVNTGHGVWIGFIILWISWWGHK
jgi:hypothetical protein